MIRSAPAPLRAVLIAIVAISIGAGLAACGSASEEDLRAELEAGAREGAEQTGERLGLSQQARECLVEEISNEGDETDLAAITPETADAAGKRLGEAAADACLQRSGLKIMDDDPTEAQAKAVLKTTELDLKAGFVQGGLPPDAVTCAYDGLSSQLSPSEVAALINGKAPKALERIITSCLRN